MKHLANQIAIISIACLLSIPTWALEGIQLPPGFTIEEFAEIPDARSLALGDGGTIFVSTFKSGTVHAVIADDGESRIIELADGLNTPNGIAFHDGALYVAEIDRVMRFDDIEANLLKPPAPVILDIELPSETYHGWRYIGFGPDGKLYISIGAPCNVCDKDGFGQILRMNADGSERETYAEGVRNSVGFTWHPDTGDMWFTDNGRDMLGDDLPPDELNHASAMGQHFGFPYCHAGEALDAEFGSGKNCSDYRAPAQKLGPHVAALGLTVYSGDMFPPDYRGQIFIAEHGSWNRSKKIGYRISLVTIEDGTAVNYEPFATGWLQNEIVSGRPVDLLVLADGSMLVSDDHAGKLYRISYSDGESQGQ